MEQWKIFYNRHTGQQYAAYTIRGETGGEEEATRARIAAEKGIKPADIITEIIEGEK